MNTRAKAAFNPSDTLAVAKANCAPKRNPPRPRGGSKSTDPKRKEPATPTPKLKAPDKGPSEPKPDPEKSIEKALLPSSTPDDPKKARKGRQGPGSTPPGISSLKEAVIGGNPKGDPEAADSPRTPGDNPPVILLGQQTPSENGDDEFPDPSKKIDFGANLAQSEESSDDTFKPSSSDHDETTDDDGDDDDDVTGFLHGLASWRNGEEVAANCPTPLKGDLRSAYEAQSAIGWGALWFGFASSHWQIVQQHYFRAAGSRRTGERWVAALIKKLQDAAWDMWSFRNFQIHSGHDEEAETEVTILNQRIRVHYQLGTLGLLPEAKPLFNTPLGRVLQRPLRARIAWLETVAMSREAYMQVRLPHKLRCYFRLRFLKGGLLARLKRSDKPPTLRLSSAAPRTRLEHLDPQLDP